MVAVGLVSTVASSFEMGSKRKLGDDQNGTSTVMSLVVWWFADRVLMVCRLDDHVRKKVLAQPNAMDCSNADASEACLGSLLDFSALSSLEDVSARFDAIAQSLLCTHVLSIVHNNVRTNYEILELEFYLQKAGCHEDPFTHGSIEQERSGQW